MNSDQMGLENAGKFVVDLSALDLTDDELARIDGAIKAAVVTNLVGVVDNVEMRPDIRDLLADKLPPHTMGMIVNPDVFTQLKSKL